MQPSLEENAQRLQQIWAAEQPGAVTNNDNETGEALKSYLDRKLAYDWSSPGGVDVRQAVQLAQLPGMCEWEGVTWGDPWVKGEALVREALAHMLKRVKSLASTRQLHYRLLFSSKDGAGGLSVLLFWVPTLRP